MRYLSIVEIFELYEAIISSSGGSYGIRDIKALESAINQPQSRSHKSLIKLLKTFKRLLTKAQ